MWYQSHPRDLKQLQGGDWQFPDPFCGQKPKQLSQTRKEENPYDLLTLTVHAFQAWECPCPDAIHLWRGGLGDLCRDDEPFYKEGLNTEAFQIFVYEEKLYIIPNDNKYSALQKAHG